MTKIIGLTGGIGSGKSTVASYIASKGVPVYIADDEAKKIMEREDIKQKIQNLFAESILNSDKSLNRKKIADFVFKNPEKLKELNAIVHPEVHLHFKNWVKYHEKYPFVVKEVAILFETGGNKQCDKVILITAPEDIRIARAMSRDNLTKEEILVRIKNQYSDEKKKKMSDFVVDNTDLKDTFLKIDNILKILAKS